MSDAAADADCDSVCDAEGHALADAEPLLLDDGEPEPLLDRRAVADTVRVRSGVDDKHREGVLERAVVAESDARKLSDAADDTD